MDNNDQLLLAQGAGYEDAEIDKYTNVIAINKNKHGAWSVFTLDCADTRERLCENLKISIEYINILINTNSTNAKAIKVTSVNGIYCTTQKEIHRVINTVALAIMKKKKNAT